MQIKNLHILETTKRLKFNYKAIIHSHLLFAQYGSIIRIHVVIFSGLFKLITCLPTAKHSLKITVPIPFWV